MPFPKCGVLEWHTWRMCLIHGLSKEVLKPFAQMCEEALAMWHHFCLSSIKQLDRRQTSATCSRAGLVDEGMCCYASMITVCISSAKLEQYSCMVDLYSHSTASGEYMKRWCHANHIWKALLSACRIHSNIEMEEHVAKCRLELGLENVAGYVLLSNIYAAASSNRHLWECRTTEKRKRCEETSLGLHLDWRE